VSLAYASDYDSDSAGVFAKFVFHLLIDPLQSRPLFDPRRNGGREMERLCATCRSVRIAVFAATIVLTATLPLAAEDRTQQPSASAITQWITDLGSPSFRTRETAMRGLVEVGASAVEPILQATQSDDPEVASCAVRILTMKATNDWITFDVLSTMAQSDSPQAMTARHIVGSTEVQSGNQTRMRERVNQFVRQVQIDLKEGDFIAAQEKANQAIKLDKMLRLFAADPKVLLSEDEFAKVELAVKSGDAHAKNRLKLLTPQRNQRIAKSLLRDVRIAIKKEDFDSALKKAVAALKLCVAYGVFDDRPDLVLADIGRLKNIRAEKVKR